MCGIIGIAGKNEFSVNDMLKTLKRLEYRGYDSYGFVTDNGFLMKKIGEISFVQGEENSKFRMAIAHTRWATHGGIAEENAHPHTDCQGKIFIVHNGIIENYIDIKNSLEKNGHEFVSQTDSEVIAHYFEDKLKSKSMEDSIQDFFSDAEGTFAVLIYQEGSDRIYAFKRDSPLVLGIAKGMLVLASDIYAFADRTDRAIFFDDNEFAYISENDYKFFDRKGKKITKHIEKFQWFEEKKKKCFDHFMLKEIHDEPEAVERLLGSLKNSQKEKFIEMKKLIKKYKRIVFVASGTSYHATLLGVYFLKKTGIESQTIIASEFRGFANINRNTLVIAISQSGETMDVIDALKHAKEKGAAIASIVNVPYSTIQRMSDISIEILAGQEICVAATKTFVNQAFFLLALAKEFGYEVDMKKISESLKKIIAFENRIKNLAKSLKNTKDIYIIGRGLSYPVAREIALKLKEISYIHAEGMMGGELKHGTLALIEKGTPVISLINGNIEIISNTKEVQARGGRVIAFSSQKTEYNDYIEIESENEGGFAILSAVAGQLLTYHIARERGLAIDKPRNLAKSVTVK